MKIVTKSNFDEDLFVEQTLAENLDKYWAEEFVKLHNDKYWDRNMSYYLAVVADDYELYDGYKVNGYY